MEDADDEVEVTGYCTGMPSVAVMCAICQKILPSKNALAVHCRKRHGGLQGKIRTEHSNVQIEGHA